VKESTASYRRILKSTSLIGGASLANIGIGLLRSKVLAVLLGPAGMGLASLFSGLLGTASSIATMGLGSVGTRQIAEAYSKGDDRTLVVARRALFLGSLALSIVGGLVVWSLRTVLAVHTLGNASYGGSVGWLAVGVTLSVGAASQSALIQGMRRIGDIARLNVIGSAGSTALGLACLWMWGKHGLIAYVVSAPLVTFVVGHIYVSMLPRPSDFRPTLVDLTAEWKILFRLGVAMLGAGLVGQLAQLWIRIDIAHVLGQQSLGQYQAAWTISMQYVTFVLAAMATDYYPRLTGVIHDREAATRLVNEQAEIALLLASPILILFMALTPWLVHLLYARSFGPSASILRWQILGDVLKVASWPLGFTIVAAGDGKTFFASETFSWIVCAGCIALLMPAFGLRMTGIAYFAMYALYLPLVYWLARRRIGYRWKRAVLALVGSSLVLCAVVGVMAAVSIWGAVLGVMAAATFAVFSLGRIARMSNIGGPVGTLSTIVSAIPFPKVTFR